MKHLRGIAIVLLLTGAICIKAQTPVYFTIISHNEITDSLQYKTNPSHFAYIKSQLLALCDTVISKQAKYNMQLDANFIFGALNFDNAANNPNDIIEWAHNSPYIDVDGHNHFDPFVNPFNYSDLAKLLDSCGIVMTKKVLGSNWANPTQTWTQYQIPKAGYTYTDYYWQPEILWGMASPGHTNDLEVFGVWKPLSPNSKQLFLQHNPNGELTAIGGGCKDEVSYILDVNHNLVRTTNEVIASIKSIVDDIQTLPSGSNDFYTINMLINFRDIPLIPSFADSIGIIIDGIQDYVDQGKIIWATLGEKYDLWYAQHTNPDDYFNYECTELPLGLERINSDDAILIYPNPTAGIIHFSLPENTTIKMIEIYNSQGRKIYSADYTVQTSIEEYPSGIYYTKIMTNTGEVLNKKIMKF